jgi:hypothetical protein
MAGRLVFPGADAPRVVPDSMYDVRRIAKEANKMTNNGPLPGWYTDPDDPNNNRYWDGGKWTESRVPNTISSVTVVNNNDTADKINGACIAGYIFAVLVPIVGFVIGLTQINRNKHGIWVVIASVAMFAIYLALV